MAEKQERRRKYSRQDISDLRDAFRVFDKDDDGSIDATELGGVLGMLGMRPSKKELKKMIEKLDTDENGTVDFPEFVQYMSRHSEPVDEETELKEAFQVFDKNGDGCITAAELKKVLKKMDSTLSDDFIQQMIEDVDENGDGVIDYKEFARMATLNADQGQSESDSEEKR